MNKLSRYVSLLISLIVFLPLLFVSRDTFNQSLSGTDLVLSAPIVLHASLLVIMLSFVRHESRKLTLEEKKAYRILVIGAYVLAIPLLTMVVAVGGISTSVILSVGAGLAFALVDLFLLIKRVTEVKQLRLIVFRGVFLPAFVGLGLFALTLSYTSWQYVFNPVALFYIFRTSTLTD